MHVHTLQLVYRELCSTSSAFIDFFSNLTSNVEFHYCSTFGTSTSGTACSPLGLYNSSSSPTAHIPIYTKLDLINLNHHLAKYITSYVCFLSFALIIEHLSSNNMIGNALNTKNTFSLSLLHFKKEI